MTQLSPQAVQERLKAGQTLQKAELSYGDFWNALLADADLQQANLTLANLKLANLAGANLSQVNLENAQLDGASFTSFIGAQVKGALFAGATGSTQEQKDNLRHQGALNVG